MRTANVIWEEFNSAWKINLAAFVWMCVSVSVRGWIASDNENVRK